MTLRPADLGATTGNWIGRHQFPQLNVSYLNAAVDEFQIYDRALSALELQSLMSAADTPRSGRVAWYRFDEAPGKDVVDASGRGRHGTIIAPTDGRRHPGFLSAYPETPFIRLEEFATYGGNQGIWAPYYTLHKIMAGLLDAHGLAGNDAGARYRRQNRRLGSQSPGSAATGAAGPDVEYLHRRRIRRNE